MNRLAPIAVSLFAIAAGAVLSASPCSFILLKSDPGNQTAVAVVALVLLVPAIILFMRKRGGR